MSNVEGRSRRPENCYSTNVWVLMFNLFGVDINVYRLSMAFFSSYSTQRSLVIRIETELYLASKIVVK